MRRVPAALIVVLLAAMAVAMRVASLQETQNWDEGIHLAAGYSALRTGDYRMNPEHPPLAKLLCALPLLTLNPDPLTGNASWKNTDQVAFGDDFLYRNRVDPERMLQRARLGTMLLALLLAGAIAVFTWKTFGPWPAVLATLLYAADSNFLAHGHYVTTDVALALFSFIAAVSWTRFLSAGGRVALVLASLSLGLALASKFSAAFLLPVFFVLWLLQVLRDRRVNWKRTLAGVSAALVGAVLVIWLVYGQATIRSFNTRLGDWPNRQCLSGYLIHRIGKATRLPSHPYIEGMWRFAEHYNTGHRSYLLGQVSDRGWWFYFPVAFAVKTPAAVLLLMAAAAWILLRAARRGWRPALVASPWWAALALPPLLFFLLAIRSNTNLGIRHILPVYPFLYTGLAAAVFHPAVGKRLRTGLLIAVVALQSFETVRIFPHFTAFFNVFAGGPERGLAYLSDSNIDWGQDIEKLVRYLREHHISEPVMLSYFGRADLGYYGLRSVDLPHTDAVERSGEPDGVAAVSATELAGQYGDPRNFAWLRRKQPTARIGYSIYLYDLRKKR